MVTFILKNRAPQLQEKMDRPDCDARLLANTYRQFTRVNALLSGWKQIYKTYILPRKPSSLLDIGCGGGDVARAIKQWAKRDGFKLQITGIDPDARAIQFAKQDTQGITFRQAHSRELVKEKQVFDIVISNHLLHHLNAQDMLELCKDARALSTKLVIHNDIERSDVAYLGFALLKPLFWRSFITEDGLRSIRRSYTKEELEQVAPAGWQLSGLPFRNLLIYKHQ